MRRSPDINRDQHLACISKDEFPVLNHGRLSALMPDLGLYPKIKSAFNTAVHSYEICGGGKLQFAVRVV